MPYYYPRRWRRWRRRRYTRWRPRAPLRRRWRRRQRRVRRKLKKIPLYQWQPKTIRKSYIKGLQPLFLANKKTLSKNYRMYEHSLIPEHYPGGGGFSVTKYSLEALYEQHELDRNWWTKTNQYLPLVRYCGCKLKFYQSYDVDYVVNWSLCNPMLATQLLYHSCQPSFMMMNKQCIFVPSKLTQKLRKPYKIIKLPPPDNMENKWYFQHDITKQGLVMLTCSAASFDHYYISTQDESNNISFTTLNPHFWMRHDFIQPPAEGYSPSIIGTTPKHMWVTHNVVPTLDVTKLKLKDLTYLGETKILQAGQQITQQNFSTYFDTYKNWGNPFKTEYLTGADTILLSNKPIATIKQMKPNETLQTDTFSFLSQELLHTCRYSPDRDTGVGNKIYLKSVNRDTTGWEPPTKEELISEGFPLWILFFGFLDFQRKLGELTNITRSYVLVFESKFISPNLPYYIPLDHNFIENTSPYLNPTEHSVTDTDKNQWYPCTLYQQETVENFVNTGPGIAKLDGRKSVEAKLKYQFCFKFGGCAPKMETVVDPSKQEVYPLPSNQFQPYALQNPAMPPETYLYQFDVQKDILTKRATERITKDWLLRKSLFTDGNKMDVPTCTPQETETPQETSSDSEKEEETLFQHLHKLRRKRQQLQLKLLKLMNKE
nr:ORF1 [nabpantry virus 4]